MRTASPQARCGTGNSDKPALPRRQLPKHLFPCRPRADKRSERAVRKGEDRGPRWKYDDRFESGPGHGGHAPHGAGHPARPKRRQPPRDEAPRGLSRTLLEALMLISIARPLGNTDSDPDMDEALRRARGGK